MWTASSALTWITVINFLILAVTARVAPFSHSSFRGRHSFRPSRTRHYYIAPIGITLPVSKRQQPPPQLDFTDLHPLVDRPKIGTSACDSVLEQNCPTWRLDCRDEKWIIVDPIQYTGHDPTITSKTYFARPSECEEFVTHGQITVAEYIRHQHTLAENGLWRWTDISLEEGLKRSVGRKYFDAMASLNETSLDELVKMEPKQQIRYLDYPTECKLRKLLKNAQKDDAEGEDARNELNKHKEFYRKWGIALFGQSTVEKEADVKESMPLEAVSGVRASSGGAPSRKLCAWILAVAIVCACFSGSAGFYLFVESGHGG